VGFSAGDRRLAVVRDPLGGRHRPCHPLRASSGPLRCSGHRDGGNLLGAAEAACRYARVKIWCFVLCSFLSGAVGIVDAVKYGSMTQAIAGVNYILYAVEPVSSVERP